MRIVLLFGALLIVGGIVALVVVLATRGRKASEPSSAEGRESYFDGSTIQYIGWKLLTGLITAVSFGIAYPWALCMMTRWEVKHTVINGRRLRFTGYGIQIFGWYILWSFLTVITLGIYSVWFGLGMEKWKVKHTVYADEADPVESRFTGGAGGWFINHLLYYLLTLCTFGIATAWAEKNILQWKARHTEIGGSPLVFTGTGGQLFVKYLLAALLTPLTLGIFGLFCPVIILKWQYKNTKALYRTSLIISRARAHEEAANKDFAKLRLAANDTELAIVKSGLNGNETQEQLEVLAESGNPYAKYQLSVILKGESERFEGESLGLLKSAAEANYHEAMHAFAPYAANADEYVALLDGSAKRGNGKAVWQLKKYFEARAFAAVEKSDAARIDDLTKAVYWFKIAIELELPEAVAEAYRYNAMLETLAIMHCKVYQPSGGGSNVAAIVIAAVLGGVVLIGGIVGALTLLGFERSAPESENDVAFIEVAYGDYGCILDPSDLYRYPASEYKTYDFDEHNFEYEGLFYNERLEIWGYLGSEAYYDRDKEILYLDFGVSPESTIQGDQKFSVYLVCEDIYDENSHYKILSGVLRPGERIAEIPCTFPEKLTSADIHVVVYNGATNAIKGTSAIASTDGNNAIYISGGTYNIHDYQWVADVYEKRITITYEKDSDIGEDPNGDPGNDDHENGDNENSDNENAADIEEAIVGNWNNVYRAGDYLLHKYYIFNYDGTFESGATEYIHTLSAPEIFSGYPEGWEIAPMGHPYSYGSYYVKDGVIYLTYEGDSIDGDAGSRREVQLTVYSVDGDLVTMAEEGRERLRYIKNFNYSEIEDLCKALGVDYSYGKAASGSGSYTEADVNDGKNTALDLINTCVGSDVGGHAVLDLESAVELYNEAYSLVRRDSPVFDFSGNLYDMYGIDNSVPEIVVNAYGSSFVAVNGNGEAALLDIAKRYFSCFSDNAALEQLRDLEFSLIDGRLYDYYEAVGYGIGYARFEEEYVLVENGNGYILEVRFYADPEKVDMYFMTCNPGDNVCSYPIIFEDGVWVFESVGINIIKASSDYSGN